jgi:hypothetical protein
MIRLIVVFILISINCFSQKKSAKPFQLDIEYSTFFSNTKIHLTEEKITITTTISKDSITKNVNYSDTLQSISEMDISKLNNYYSNACVDDGISITIQYRRNGYYKKVIVDNYYQNDISKIIEFVNSLIPKDYKIWYDKNELISEYEKCNIKNN